MTDFGDLFFSSSRLGLRQLTPAGARVAGLKRSAGFVVQPVENWSRYPEFAGLVDLLPPLDAQSRVLDLGSPKMFGLFLASRFEGHYRLTDLWDVAIDEVRELERANRAHLRGSVEFGVADLTGLTEVPDASCSHVYSMSVIEHIHDLDATTRGLAEMSRVLRPGGTLVLSFPVGPAHREEWHESEVYGRQGERVFFSHYFDRQGAERLLDAVPDCDVEVLRYSRWNTDQPWLRAWRGVPQKLRGLLGVVNLAIASSATTVVDLDPVLRGEIPHEGDWIARLVKRGA